MDLSLDEVTLALAKDLQDLRAGEITNADARVRAQLARELLRAVHYQIEGMKIIDAKTAESLTGSKANRKNKALTKK